MRAAETEAIDAALLDINLTGQQAYPVADILARRGIPFGFLTGYGEADLREEYRQRPVLKKPFTQKTLIALAAQLVASSKEAAPGPAAWYKQPCP